MLWSEQTGDTRMRSMKRSIAIALAVSVGLVGLATIAAAAPTSYSATETIPVPPESGFEGSGGGDGWAVAVTSDSVLNVHHHNTRLTVACRRQIDASQCWTAATKTVSDGSSNNFGVWHPGLAMVQTTNRLYVFAVRTSDNVGGVVCIDAMVADEEPNPFCGFTELTAAGEAQYNLTSNGVVVGDRFLTYNHGTSTAGAWNKVLCFELITESPCANQPYDIGVQAGSSAQPPTIAAIDDRVLVPVANGSMFCFDVDATAGCAGTWPVSVPTGVGAPYPLLASDGGALGVCIPQSTNPCFDFAGSSVASPVGLAAAVGTTSYWNGPALTLGPRVYVPNGRTNSVGCFDYAVGASCPNFPRSLQRQSLTYTVNPDPQRPTCIWTNADNGSAQIQNFDAFSGMACGEGPIRVLASSIVVDSPECIPTTYTSLAVEDPPASQYGSGLVAFEDGSGRPITGVDDVPLDADGVADLRGLDLNTDAGLPQFLITLEDPVGAPGSVTVRLTWTGEEDPGCDPGGPGPEAPRIVSLGDSYSSGEGPNEPWDEGTDRFFIEPIGRVNGCHRSALAWPRLIGVAQADHLACSGAKRGHFEEGQEDGSPDNVGQLDRLEAIVASAPEGDPVDIVVLTIGGNDLGFAKILTDCYYKECLKRVYTVEQRKATKLRSKLRRTYEAVVSSSGGARVVVVGYPRLFSDDGDTGNCAWLEPVELQRLNDLQIVFEGVQRNAALDAGVEFVSLYNALDGRELCTDRSVIEEVNPFTHLPRNGSSWQEQGHPRAEGQQLMAAAVEEYLSN